MTDDTRKKRRKIIGGFDKLKKDLKKFAEDVEKNYIPYLMKKAEDAGEVIEEIVKGLDDLFDDEDVEEQESEKARKRDEQEGNDVVDENKDLKEEKKRTFTRKDQIKKGKEKIKKLKEDKKKFEKDLIKRIFEDYEDADTMTKDEMMSIVEDVLNLSSKLHEEESDDVVDDSEQNDEDDVNNYEDPFDKKKTSLLDKIDNAKDMDELTKIAEEEILKGNKHSVSDIKNMIGKPSDEESVALEDFLDEFDKDDEEYDDLEDKWNDYMKLGGSERSKNYFTDDNKLHSVILTQQFTRPSLEHLFRLANAIRVLAKTPSGAMYLRSLLPHVRSVSLYKQPSSRTMLSHLFASQLLGIMNVWLNDMSISSEVKGESELDTIKTISEFASLIIMRHPSQDFVEKAAWYTKNYTRRKPHFINAGSGKDQHPTQALLDFYTMFRKFSEGSENRSIDGKVIMCAGDNTGRTVASLMYLAALFNDMRIILCAPDEYQLPKNHPIFDYLKKHNVRVEFTDQFEDALRIADIIYMTRIQDEYKGKNGGVVAKGAKPSTKFDKKFALTKRRLQLVKSGAFGFHPQPRRGEMPRTIDFDRRIVLDSQVRNGMWIRAAIIADMYQAAELIFDELRMAA